MQNRFSDQVYDIVGRIPRGTVTTYGLIARMLGRPQSARYVGFALRSAPQGLPCHRVVNQQGDMAPQDAFGSRDFQRELLRSEGIAFLPNGRIDMKKHLWMG